MPKGKLKAKAIAVALGTVSAVANPTVNAVALGEKIGADIAVAFEQGNASAAEQVRQGALIVFPQGSAALVQFVEAAISKMGKALGSMSIRVMTANYKRLALRCADAKESAAALKLLESGQAVNADNMKAAGISKVSTRGRPTADKGAKGEQADPVATLVAVFKGFTREQQATAAREIFAVMVAKIADPKARVAGAEIIEAYAKAA